jgi:Uma2 family endonuclease
MEFADLDLSQEYSYADYLKWTFEDRVEMIKGKLFNMSPAPNLIHQRLSARIANQLFNFMKGKTCEVFTAPFDVRFPGRSKRNKDIDTVVQPDLCIICDPGVKLDKHGCLGAPDIAIEILSPGNSRRELDEKYRLYEESGVKEYWVLMYDKKICIQYTHNWRGCGASDL